MTPEEIVTLFEPFYKTEFVNLVNLEKRPPLLAHYTTLETLEKIITTNEIWFSNPLFMNDLQEMRFGIIEGLKAFNEVAQQSAFVDACGSKEREAIISNWFHAYFQKFDAEHALDVYVFCLSEHDPKNTDGVLSMWRGYGANGHGAALVFNTDFVTLKPSAPLLFAKVRYASAQERIDWMKGTFLACVKFLTQHDIANEQLYIVAHQMFTLMEIFSLVSKHPGFLEEQEWRVIYLPERDTAGLLKKQFSYVMGKNGIEPKLRYKIEPLKIDPPETWTFNSILNTIILGPTLSSPLVVSSVRRMLEVLEKPDLLPKLSVSGIPLRPTK